MFGIRGVEMGRFRGVRLGGLGIRVEMGRFRGGMGWV